MISIIISSAGKQLLTSAQLNIEKTIGTPFEIISTDNHLGATGLCEVYNDSASKAKYEILCFMHEDLEIKTPDWGYKVVEKFRQHADLGVLGVAGSAYKTFAPSGWDVEGDEGGMRYLHYLQAYKSSSQSAGLIYSNAESLPLAPVVCVDGMWFCTLKKLVINHPFDQQLLKGFHGYDMDFCLALYPKYKVAVTFDILMEHFSEGSFNTVWFEEIIRVHHKWQHLLPLKAKEISPQDAAVLEKRALKRAIKYYLTCGYSKKHVLRQIGHFRRSGKIKRALFLKLAFYLFRA